MILRFFDANGRKFTAHTVNTLTKFLYIVVGFQVFGYFWIAREVGVADVVCADDAWQFARSLEHNTVIEHLYLYLRALDAVIAVANRIHCHLLYHKFWIFPVRLEESVLAQIGMLLHLGFEIVDCFLYLVEDASLEGKHL